MNAQLVAATVLGSFFAGLVVGIFVMAVAYDLARKHRRGDE